MNTNSIKTFLFLIVLTALFVFIGGLIGGQQGVIIAFVIAVAMNFFTYWFSSSIVLKMYKAQEVTEEENSQLLAMVRKLAQTANIPMPKVYIIPDGTPNAFATGRNPQNGVVAVTSGIMQMLNREELEGVVAHELTHIQGRDILISTIAATVAGAIMMLANFARYAAILGGGNNRENNVLGMVALVLVSILAPIAALIVQMAISRTREYQADSGAAQMTKKPLALASALNKISYGVHSRPSDAHPATAHMFIMNPLSGKKAMSLFSTHPNTEDRIERLKEIDKQMYGASSPLRSSKPSNPMFR